MANSSSTSNPNKAVIWVIIAILAIAIAAFSAYKSLIAPQQGRSVGQLDMFPGGKAGLMKGGPAAAEEGGGAPAPAPGTGR